MPGLQPQKISMSKTPEKTLRRCAGNGRITSVCHITVHACHRHLLACALLPGSLTLRFAPSPEVCPDPRPLGPGPRAPVASAELGACQARARTRSAAAENLNVKDPGKNPAAVRCEWQDHICVSHNGARVQQTPACLRSPAGVFDIEICGQPGSVH